MLSDSGRVGQYRLYKIETVMIGGGHEPCSVYRRFRDFEWLY